MKKTRLLLFLGAGIAVACGFITLAGTRTEPASAAIACVPHQNTAEELQFVAMVQSWRNSNIPGSHQLTRSISLNKAAWHYARFLADTPGAAGHFAEPGYTGFGAWSQRAIDCGYNVPAGGEGLAVVEGSGVVSVPPSAALATMAAHQGSGIWIPANVGADVKCIGVGKAVSADGRKVAWVTLLMATWSECADPDSSGPSEPNPPAPPSSTTTTTGTATATNTPTKTPTPTATPSPTPNANYGVSIRVCGGWNLVTVPVSGPVEDIFDTAEEDLGAIYVQNGETWLRWAPDVPAYARNLSHVSGGDVLWIYRSEPSCEDIGL